MGFTNQALLKVQTIFMIALIIIAAAIGLFYYLLNSGLQNNETIKIGLFADLDNFRGQRTWEGALLATDQINAEGGILGKKIELIGRDSDIETKPVDMNKVSTALTQLITKDKVDFVLGLAHGEIGFVSQDIVAEHKKIFFALSGNSDELTQRVIDDYENYKYYFKIYSPNSTSVTEGLIESILQLREYTGFNKLGYLAEDATWTKEIRENFDAYLPELYGFDLVYQGLFPRDTIFDFSSFFANAEAAGTEMLITLISGGDEGIIVAKEWYDRQSPMVVWGINGKSRDSEFWEWTEGKCENIVFANEPASVGYPLTNETVPMYDEYFERWGRTPINSAIVAYDVIRFILPDAIERAGTIDTDPVINALEETQIETSMVRNFVFTSSHDVLVGENPNDPDKDYFLELMFQWQTDGIIVPVHPKEIMEEAGATFMFPPWDGPWD